MIINDKRHQPLNSNHKSYDWYDPLEEVGSIEKAKLHANANRPMQVINAITSKVDFCKCCLLPVATPGIVEPFSFCSTISSYSVLGVGTILYFYLILFCIFINFLFLLLVSAPEVYHSYTIFNEIVTYCNTSVYNETVYNDTCNQYENVTSIFSNENWLFQYNYNAHSKYIRLYKLINGKLPHLVINYCILSLIPIGLLFIINVIFIMIMNNRAHEGRMLVSSPSDYSVFIDNLECFMKDYENYKESIDKDILKKTDKEIFQNFILEDLLQIEDSKSIAVVNYCYKINYFMELQKAENEAKKMLSQLETRKSQKDMNKKMGYTELEGTLSYFERCCCCKKRIEKKELIKGINYAHLQMEIQKTKLKNNFANCLFISFNTIKDKEKFYKQYPNTKYRRVALFSKVLCMACCKSCFSEKSRRQIQLRNTIDVIHAPEPNDIMWENLEYTKKQRLLFALKTSVFSLLLIATSLTIVCLLTLLQDRLNKKFTTNNTSIVDGLSNDTKKTISSYLISFSVSISITVINLLIEILLEKITM